MGDIKIGSLSIDSAWFGSTEIEKIYVGNDLVYEKVAAAYTDFTLYISNTHCSVFQISPYHVTNGTVTLNITPECNSGEWTVFDHFYVGSSIIKAKEKDITEYTYVNHDNGSSPTLTITTPPSEEVFAKLVYNNGSFTGTTITLSKTTSQSVKSVNVLLGDHFGVLRNNNDNNNIELDLTNKYIYVEGRMGEGTVEEVEQNGTDFAAEVQDTAAGTAFYQFTSENGTVVKFCTGTLSTAGQVRLNAQGIRKAVTASVIISKLIIK